MYYGFLWYVTPLTRLKREVGFRLLFQDILPLWEPLLDGKSGQSDAFWGRGRLQEIQTYELCYRSFSCYQSDYSQSKKQPLSGELSCFQWCFLRYLGLDSMGRLWGWMGKQLSAWNSEQTRVCLGVRQLPLGNGSHLSSMQRGNSPVLYPEYLICYFLFGFFLCVSAFFRFCFSCYFCFSTLSAHCMQDTGRLVPY